jgi:hypothetical protein
MMHFILPIPLEFVNLIKKKRHGEIKHKIKLIGLIFELMEWVFFFFFFFKLFDMWYKGGLFSLILCKQLVHMYDVELSSIWIWKSIECSLDNHYYKNRCFLLVFMIGF